MTTSREAKQFFLEAVELDADERAVYLAELCLRDERLHRRVEQLLAAHQRAERAESARSEAGVETPEGGGMELPLRFGNYDLIEEIGAGGSGVVYRAHQLDLSRTVAIKLLRTGSLASEDEVRRFHIEAESAARLDHAGIVPVYEVGTHEGRHFISMKLVEGSSLDRHGERFRAPQSAASLVAQVARAVDHGHRHGVLHRDVKPSNVLIDADGRPYIADFGTAKLIDDRQATVGTVGIIGTPSYMAPEQTSPGGQVTVATDVYGLGCLLYELLAGRPPFANDDLFETLRQVREETPPLLRSVRSEVHRDLETICSTCLAKDPGRRYDSALALAEDLERWMGHRPIEARPTTALERLALTWRRKPVVSSLLVAVAVLSMLLVAGAIVAGFKLRDGLEQTRAAEDAAREQLRTAYVAEAHALRRGGEEGHRVRALELLGLAAEIRLGRDLVEEAAVCLGHTDLETVAVLPCRNEDNADVAIDPEYERYAVGSLDGPVEVRRVADAELLFTLEGNGHPALQLRFSPDGRFLSAVHAIRDTHREPLFLVWDLERRDRIFEIEALPMAYVDFAPGRASVGVIFDDGLLLERDLQNGSERSIVQLGQEGARSLRYSPDGDRIAIVGKERGPVRILDLNGELLGEFGEVDQWFLHVVWSADGTQLASGDFDGVARVWDVESRALLREYRGHQATVVNLGFVARDVLATTSWDQTTRLWSLTTGEQLLVLAAFLTDGTASGGRLAVGTHDAVHIKRLLHQDVVQVLGRCDGTAVRCLDASPDGRFAAVGGADGFDLWDLDAGVRVDGRPEPDVLSLAFQRDGTLYVASNAGLVLWEIEHGRLIGAPRQLIAGRCSSVAQDQSGELVIALSPRGIHSVKQDARPAVQIPRPDSPDDLAVSADGEWIAVGNWRGSGVHVWAAEDGSLAAHLLPGTRNCVPDFSADGRFLAVGTPRAYDFYRVGTWELERSVARRDGANARASATRFAPSGSLLAASVGSWDLGLVDAASGAELGLLDPPIDQKPSCLRFTSGGEALLIGTYLGGLIVWDIASLDQKLVEAGLVGELGFVGAWMPESLRPEQETR